MSVLIGMLKDLDKRGEMPRLEPELAKAIESSIQSAPGSDYGSGRRIALWSVLGVLAIAALAIAWRPDLLRMGRPAAPAPRVTLAGAQLVPPPVSTTVSAPLSAPLSAPAPAQVATPAPAANPVPANPPFVGPASAARPAASAALPSMNPGATSPAALPAPPTGIATTRPTVAPPAPLPAGALETVAKVAALHATPPRQPAQLLPAPAPVPDTSDTPPSATIVRHVPTADEGPELGRAYELAQRGRSVEAIEILRRSLESAPARVETRSALATLLSEGDRREEALSVLLEGIKTNPGRFAVPAARIQVEVGHPAAALDSILKVPEGQRDAQYHALAAAIAQRAGRHDIAVSEFRAALSSGTPRAILWIGLGASLEQVGHQNEALGAYRQALQTSGASNAAVDFATQRVAALAVLPERQGVVSVGELAHP